FGRCDEQSPESGLARCESNFHTSPCCCRRRRQEPTLSNRSALKSKLSRFSTTFDAHQSLPQEAPSTHFSRYPGPGLPRRIVPYVLRVTAFELGDPMFLLILMEPDDPLRDRGLGRLVMAQFANPLLVGVIK